MKRLSLSLSLLPFVLGLSACHEQQAETHRLDKLLKQNDQLQESVNQMYTLIESAGEPDASLPEQIKQAEAQLSSSLAELAQCEQDETNAKMRLLDLKNRLANFRSQFKIMQEQIISSAQ